MSEEAMEVSLAAIEASRMLSAVSALIPKAIKMRPGLATKLQPYPIEISKAERVVDLICDQEELQTSGVVAGIRMLQSHGEILKSDLVSLGKDKDEHEWEKSVEKLRIGRKCLIQQIRLAGIGLAKADGAITIDTKVVKSTDEAVKTVLGKESGLDIALFLSRLKRKPDAKGKIRLTDSEYEELTWHRIKTADPEIKTLSTDVKTRIVCNCLARDQSIQVLGPVAEDLWAGIAFIKIEGLISMGEAIQFGYPVTWDVFKEGLNIQQKRIVAGRTKE